MLKGYYFETFPKLTVTVSTTINMTVDIMMKKQIN